MKWLATTLLLLLVSFTITSIAHEIDTARQGQWELLLNSTGVVAMHMTLTRSNTVIMFDQASSGRSGMRLDPDQPCLNDDYNVEDDDDGCWAHSAEYRIGSNTIRPLALASDTWCSSAAFLSNGTLAQTGGYDKGYRRIRYFASCSDATCSWREDEATLVDNRWYATNQILPELNRMIIVGGRDVFTYEFVPPGKGAFEFPFLHQTYDRNEGGNNLYPIIHLSSDGNLFILANRDSILFDYHNNQVVKEFPTLPGDGGRSYPSTGSSVMLPLDHADGFQRVEIMVCGGASSGAYRAARGTNFLPGLSSCGRMVITDENPGWAMEEMPGPRIMSDMLILPTGDFLIINGATQGCAGWKMATSPEYNPYLYEPNKKPGERFSVLMPSAIPRMYHSSAIVLPDGRILVGGSNPQGPYTFSNVSFPTELRLEAYTPYYMEEKLDDVRASRVRITHSGIYGVYYGETFMVSFVNNPEDDTEVEFHVYAPPFATHSQSMSQRLLRLECRGLERIEQGQANAMVVAPPSPVAAPSGHYLLTVVIGHVPSKSHWVRFISAP